MTIYIARSLDNKMFHIIAHVNKAILRTKYCNLQEDASIREGAYNRYNILTGKHIDTK